MTGSSWTLRVCLCSDGSAIRPSFPVQHWCMSVFTCDDVLMLSQQTTPRGPGTVRPRYLAARPGNGPLNVREKHELLRAVGISPDPQAAAQTAAQLLTGPLAARGGRAHLRAILASAEPSALAASGDG